MSFLFLPFASTGHASGFLTGPKHGKRLDVDLQTSYRPEATLAKAFEREAGAALAKCLGEPTSPTPDAGLHVVRVKVGSRGRATSVRLLRGRPDPAGRCVARALLRTSGLPERVGGYEAIVKSRQVDASDKRTTHKGKAGAKRPGKRPVKPPTTGSKKPHDAGDR